MTLIQALGVGALFTIGTWLLLQRSLTRIAIGLGLIGHGTNLLLLLAGGGAGYAPFLGRGYEPGPFADPMPQALALTAIVIAFGTTAFLLAMAWRSWRDGNGDDVEHDVADRAAARRAASLARAGELAVDHHPAQHPEER